MTRIEWTTIETKESELHMIKTKNKLGLLAAGAIATLLGASSASALTFTATGTGPITAYFYGQSAGYGSDLGLMVQNVSQGTYGLQNHTTAPGTAFVLGNANLGDILVFELRVATGGGDGPSISSPYTYSVFSDPTMNSDGQEHAQASVFTAGTYGIPNGILVGFEDIVPFSSSDRDFNDHMFVFTGVQAEQSNRVPDGGMTFGMLGIAVAGLGLLRRKL
jgi:hypothetical protein